MYCLVMKIQSMPRRQPFSSFLTGHDKNYPTYGCGLEKLTKPGSVLRGLIAECLFREPRYRPTAIQLLKRTRQGLRTVKPEAAHASKVDERLTPVNYLLVDQWFGDKPKYVWPKRIPEMEKVVNHRMRQMYQVKCAKDFAARRRKGLDPHGGAVKGHNAPAGPARGQNPPMAESDPLPDRKPWPGAKFQRPIDIINDKRPKKQVKPEQGNIFKIPNWGRLVSRVKRPSAAAVPRPQNRPPAAAVPRPPKRPSPEPEAREDLKRLRQNVPRRLDGMNRLHNGQDGVDRNHAPRAEKNFLIPVRIWPGPSPNPADEAIAQLRTYVLPIGATIAVLRDAMLNDPTSGIRQAVRCQWSRPGTTEFLPKEIQLTTLGYGPSPQRRVGPLECFRTMNAPRGPIGEIKLIVHVPEKRPRPRVEIPKLKFKVSQNTTILHLKEAIIHSNIRPDFRVQSQLRIHSGGRDPQGRDCPDHRTIASFFDGGGGERQMWCSMRPVGQGGSGRRGAVPVRPVYNPPRVRMEKRFL